MYSLDLDTPVNKCAMKKTYKSLGVERYTLSQYNMYHDTDISIQYASRYRDILLSGYKTENPIANLGIYYLTAKLCSIYTCMSLHPEELHIFSINFQEKVEKGHYFYL